MVTKIKAFWRALHAGERIADAATWKNRQIAGNALTALLIAIAGAAASMGYDLGLTDAQLESAAIGIMAVIGVVNAILTAVTSRKVGLPGKPEADQ